MKEWKEKKEVGVKEKGIGKVEKSAGFGEEVADAFGIGGDRTDIVEDEAAGTAGADGLFGADLGGDFREGPLVGTAEAVESDAGIDRDAARVDGGAAPPAEEGGERLGATIFPIELGREVIHPTLTQPPERIGVDLVELVEPGFYFGWLAFGVNAKGAHPEERAGFFAFNELMGAADEGVDIVAPPVGEGEIPSAFAVGGVGIAVREGCAFAGRRVRIEIIVEMNAVHIVASEDIADDGKEMLLNGGSAGIHPEEVADLFGVFGEAAAGVGGVPGVFCVDGGAEGVEPGVDFDPALVTFFDEGLERVIAGGISLRAREEAAPGLES